MELDADFLQLGIGVRGLTKGLATLP